MVPVMKGRRGGGPDEVWREHTQGKDIGGGARQGGVGIYKGGSHVRGQPFWAQLTISRPPLGFS